MIIISASRDAGKFQQGCQFVKLYPKLWTVGKIETLSGGQWKRQRHPLKVDKYEWKTIRTLDTGMLYSRAV